MWQQIEALEAGQERFALVACPDCDGEGEVRGNRSNDGDPQADDFMRCPRCGGTGKP
jgi:DnaJ-class molecular chaperone